MSDAAARSLSLESLGNGIPVIPPEAAGYYKLSCMVALHHNGHRSGVTMYVEHLGDDVDFTLQWEGDVTAQHIRSRNDRERLADDAACAIALLLIRDLTSYTAIEQSAKGTTIDYYLSMQRDEHDDLIFNNSARLEVSGILSESPGNSVQRRVNEKMRRLKKEDALRDLITIVEFGRPWTRTVEA